MIIIFYDEKESKPNVSSPPNLPSPKQINGKQYVVPENNNTSPMEENFF